MTKIEIPNVYSIIPISIYSITLPKMVMDYVRGIEYIITLDKHYDYFDIIPDLEKRYRKRFEIQSGWTSRQQDQLTVISLHETQDRFLASTHCDNYQKAVDELEKKYQGITKFGDEEYSEEWTKIHQRSTFTLETLPIELTPEEIHVISDIQTFLGDKIKHSQWRHSERSY